MPVVTTEQEAAVQLSEYISEIQAALPRSERNVEKFLVLAKGSRAALEESKAFVYDVFIGGWDFADESFKDRPTAWGSPIADRRISYVPQDLFDMLEAAQDYLEETIVKLSKEPDPKAPAPEYSWPLFYVYPSNTANEIAKGLVTPVYTVPLRAVHQAEAVDTPQPGVPSLETRLIMSSISESINELPETLSYVVENASFAAEKLIKETVKAVTGGIGIPLIGMLGIAAVVYILANKK